MVVNEGYQAVPVWSTTEKRNLSKEVSPGIQSAQLELNLNL